jgi:arylsulfatase A-like enzyme
VDPPARVPSPGPSRDLMDIAPTVLTYFGLPIPKHVQGKSIPAFL